jgi:hypothetical protein
LRVAARPGFPFFFDDVVTDVRARRADSTAAVAIDVAVVAAAVAARRACSVTA